MKNKLVIIGLILLVLSFYGISCSKQLSVDEYLQQTQKIIEAYHHSTKVEVDSMNDVAMITRQGELEKGYAILEVTEHLYAEEISKYYQDWNAITPPKEFEEYHSHVSDYFYKLENNAKLISSYAEEILDDKETNTHKLKEALQSREEITDQWDTCSRLAEEALLKTSGK